MNAALREFIWIVVSLAVSAASLGLALAIGGVADDSFGESAVVRLSVAMGAWPLPAAVVTLALARATLGVDVRGGLNRSLAIAGIGGLAAAVSTAALVIWSEHHFGERFDPGRLGPTLWLPLLIGVLALAITWRLALTGHVAAFAVFLSLGASALIAVLALLNLPGLIDGVTPAGIPLAIAFASAASVVSLGLQFVVRPLLGRVPAHKETFKAD